MRDGQFIGEYPISDITEDDVIELMVGRKLSEQYPRVHCEPGQLLLEVKDLSNKYVSNINFRLRKGEILGIAGLMGSGRTELARTLYGIYGKKHGEIIVKGKSVNIKSPKDAIDHGIAYVSEDRKTNGIILNLNVRENISLSALRALSGLLGIINSEQEESAADDYINDLSIKTLSSAQMLRNLSRGNQQKVSISKSLITKPKILILDEPTRGVDVGAKKEIYEIINRFKQEGMSIIMISSEIPEILGMSDRIMVMYEGTVTGFIDHLEADQENIMRLALGKGGAYHE